MRRALPIAVALALLVGGTAVARDVLKADQDYGSAWRILNLQPPATNGEPIRRGDMPGSGLPCVLLYNGGAPLFQCAGIGTGLSLSGGTLSLTSIPAGTSVLGELLFTAASATVTPPTGFGRCRFDATNRDWTCIDAYGLETHGVQTSLPGGNFVIGIGPDGYVYRGGVSATQVAGLWPVALTGNGSDLNPASTPLDRLAQSGATTGQVASWNGTTWVPATAATGGITQLTGQVLAGPGSGSQATTLATNTVTLAQMQQLAGLSLLGRSANSTGNMAAITATSGSNGVLRESGGALGFGNISASVLSGLVPCSNLPPLTGDVTSTGCATTVANLPNGATWSGWMHPTNTTVVGTPSAGTSDIWVDATAKTLFLRDDAGNVSHGVRTSSAGAHQFVNGLSDAGVLSYAQPAAADVSGLAAIATSGSATDLVTGTVPALRLGSFTNGSVLFWNGGLAQDNANNFWDSANGRLGIGTNAPSVRLHLKGTLTSNAKLYVENTAAGASDYTEFGIISSAGVGSRASIYLTSPAYTGIDGANALTLQAATSGTINMFTGTGTTMALTVTNNGASAGSIRIPSLSAGGMARAAATTGQLSIAIAQASGATTAGADYQGPGAYVTSGTGPVTFSGPGAAATSLNLAGGSVSGALPCGSLPSLIGDLTNSGCTLTLWPNIVTFAKFQQLAANSLMMNPTASTANAQAVSLGGTAGLTEWVPGAPGTFNVYAAGSGRIPRGSGTSGQLTDGADLVFSPSAEQLQLVYSIATGTNGLLLNNTSAGTGAITDLRFRNDTSKLAEIYLTSSTYAGTESAPSALTVTTGAGQSFIVSPNNGPQLKVSTVGIEHIADTYLDSILSAGYLSTGAGGKVTGNAWPAAGMLTGASGSLTGISFGANQIAYGSGTSGQLTSSSALQWSPTSTQLQLSYSHATGTNGILLNNTSSGTSAFTDLRFQNDAGKLAEIYLPSSTYTGTETGPSDLTIATNSSTQAVYVSPNGTPELKISNIGTETLGDTYLDTVLGAGYLSTAAGGKIVGNAWPTSGQIVYISGSNAVGSANLTFTGTNLILGGDVKVGGISPSTLVATDTGDFLASVTVDPSLSFASNTLSLPAVATAGTYGASVNVIRSITIDSKGRTTAISTSNKPQSFAVTWAMNQTGMSMGQDRSQLLFPGMAAAPLATQSNTAGSAVATTMAAFWGTSNSPPTIPLRDGYNGVSMSVDVPIVVGSGSSTATLAFSLFEVSTSPSTAANYTPICTAFSPTLATGAQSSFQTIGCTGSASASNSSLVLVVYRSDVNGLYTLTSLQFQAIATIWATP